jgi:ATP-dependent exoDNAse (exonuclease V) alpha subunit
VCLEDKRTGEVHDYTRKQGIEHTELLLPEGVSLDREQLWNAAEGTEKRRDARVAREFELALPAELTSKQRRELVTNFAKSLVDKYGVAADVAVHEPSRKGDQRNHHAHILITTRQLAAQGFGEKTNLEREDKALRTKGKPSGREQIEALRADWANRCNTALQRAGHQERVSHKSLVAQGISREPTTHLGPVATAMERRGERSERGDLNREPDAVRTARAEIAAAEHVQTGAERMRAQAREWRDAQEQIRLAAEREAAKEKAQAERDRQEQERRVELAAKEKAQIEKDRFQVEQAFLSSLYSTRATYPERRARAKVLADEWVKAADREKFKRETLDKIMTECEQVKLERQRSRGPSLGR